MCDRTSRHDNVEVEVLPDVHITLHDGGEGGLVDTVLLLSHQAGLEQHLRASESFISHRDDLQPHTSEMSRGNALSPSAGRP